MEAYKIKNLSFTYPNSQCKEINDISLTVNSGEFLLLCGESGCGKTTLLRLLKPSLSPSGELIGEINFNGTSLWELGDAEEAAKIGFVMQNPDNQIVCDKVWHELAFGLENLGCPTEQMRVRIAEMASFFGIQNWFYKKTSQLSGGQKQLLNLVSIMVMQPDVLILDEPTSQLDPIAAAEFLRIVKKINDELGTTVILTEHRLDEAFAIADRVLVMENGRITADDTPKKIGEILTATDHYMCDALPVPMRVYSGVDNSLECPVTIRQGRAWLAEMSKTRRIDKTVIPKEIQPAEGITAIEVKDVYFRYERDIPDVIRGLNLKVYKGEIYALMGGNGSGKTTALSLISGLLKPQRGKIFVNGTNINGIKNLYNGLIGVLPQNPQNMFAKNSVYAELFDMTNKELDNAKREEAATNAAKLCKIDGFLNRYPYDLSGGEQQRLALAMVLLKEPEILILDEPTKGMDAGFKLVLADILAQLKTQGVTILTVSHDIEFCAEFADRCALLFDGGITTSAPSRRFFCGNSFYTTGANRMAGEVLPEAILPVDIIGALNGKIKPRIRSNTRLCDASPYKDIPTEVLSGENQKNITQSIITALFILVAIPLTIYIGTKYLGNRRYYLTSLLVIFEVSIPFFAAFERRRPNAREIVLISILCALTVASRMAFFATYQIKPMAAFIIVAGICYGGETGFLVGAVSAFVSNFFFGQGPWTPWQMFAFGMIGFFAGIVFKNDKMRKSIYLICVYGVLSVLIVYGGIMNFASALMMSDKLNWGIVMSYFAAGFLVDIVHSLSTGFFLFVFAKAVMEKLERVKIKYGIMKR